MGISPAIFETVGLRTEHLVPGAFTRSAAIGGGGGVSAGNLAILGKSKSGKPCFLNCFSTLADAKEVLSDGELLKAVAYAFDASGDYRPQKVYAMVVNGNTQASRTLKSGSTDAMTVKTAEYGIGANASRMRLSAGTASGSKKVEVWSGEKQWKVDNIERKMIAASYAGTGDAATCTITATSITFSASLSGAEIAGETLELQLATYKTIKSVIDAMNATSAWAGVLLEEGAEEVDSGILDIVTSKAISTSTATPLCANVNALQTALESIEAIGKGNVEILSPVMPDVDANEVYFAGASAGTYTATDWNAALEALALEDVQIISTPSTDSAVHTLIANHCADMSTVVNRKERTCFLGGGRTQTLDEAVAAAGGFDSKLVSYCFPSITAVNPISAEAEELPASYFAVKCAGMESAASVNMPLTNKKPKISAFSKKLSISEQEKLIAGGVLCGGENVDGDLVVIRAMTTYQSDVLQLCERSMVREDLYMNRDLRKRYGVYIGKPNLGAANFEAVLDEAALAWERAGMILRGENGLIFDKIVSVDGDKIYVSFGRYLVAPTNFIFVTVANYVYTA